MRGYKTSKDYKLLRELLDKGCQVVILWNESEDGYTFPKAFVGRKGTIKGYEKYYYLGALTWSEDYINGAGWDFEPYCKAHKIEFIVPEV